MAEGAPERLSRYLNTWHVSINRDQPLSGIGFASIQILSHAGYHNTPLDNRAQKRSSFILSAE